MKGLARYRLLAATLVVLLAGLSVLAAGCPRRAPEEDPGAEVTAGGIMIRGSIADAQTMNPIYVADTASGDITHHLFQNSLMAWNREVELVPNAAESFPEVSADELIYTFRLRPGQTWHDGQPFTSHDVVFTYESFMNPFYTGPRRADMAMFLGYKAYVGELAAAKRALDAKEIDQEAHDRRVTEAFEAWRALGAVRALDDLTVRFILETPMAIFLTRTAGYHIIPRHILGEVHGRDVKDHGFSRNPVGSGPFRWKEWLPDQHIALVGNADWEGGRDGKPPAHSDELVTRVIPDQKTLEIALEAKEIDFGGVTPEEYERFKAMPHLRLMSTPTFAYTYLGLNLANPLFQDVRVRHAISHAINKEVMVDELLMGHGTVAWTHGSPARWDYNPDVRTFPFDAARAKSLLAEAGWTPGADGILQRDGVRFSFLLQTNLGNRMREQAAVVIQSNLKDVGIEVEIKLVEWATFVSDVLLAKNFETVIVGWSLGVDPDAFSIWHTEGGPFNFVSYSNARVDELLEEGRRVGDIDRRREIYQEMQAILAEDQPYVFLFYPNAIHAVGNRIRGEIKVSPIASPLFYAEDLWIPAALQAGPHLN